MWTLLWAEERSWRMSESESELHWRFTANQFVLATSSLRLTTSNFFLQLNILGYSPYVTSSLTREWVCRLQLLLVLASAVILKSKSRGTHNHILLSPTWRDRSSYLYPPVTGWPSYTPRHWVPFWSPPTTRRATVEVFDPSSTRTTEFSSQLFLDLRVGPNRKHRFLTIPILLQRCVYLAVAWKRQFFYCYVRVHFHRNLFTEWLLSNEYLLWLRCSGSQASYHNTYF
jgi:hypothetical protein